MQSERESNPRGGDVFERAGRRWLIFFTLFVLFFFFCFVFGAVQGGRGARMVVMVAALALPLRRAGGMWRVRLRLMTLAPAGEV